MLTGVEGKSSAGDPTLKRNLQTYGYRVVIILDEEDALERVGGGQFQTDSILVDLIRKLTEEYLTTRRRIHEHVKDEGRMPLVVQAEKYRKDVEGTDAEGAPNDWITYLEDADQLGNLLVCLSSDFIRFGNRGRQ